MKEFNPSATCIKCGFGTIKSEHYDEFIPSDLHRAFGHEPYPEHMERTCLVCGYTWDEAPLKPTTPVHDVVKEASATTFDASDIEPPVIEVGDTVKYKTDPSDEWGIVIGIDETDGRFAIRWYDGSIGNTWLRKDLTLIQKAPKVITFEGITIRPLVKHDHIVVLANAPQLYPDGFVELSGNGKRYKLDLTEVGT